MTQPVVLLIEDDASITHVLSDFLQDEGYQCLVAHSTAQVWPLLERQHPALIVLDIHVETREAGWALLREVRGKAATSTIPILLVSADAYFLNDQAEAIRAYNLTVLPKPFDLDQLSQSIEQALVQ